MTMNPYSYVVYQINADDLYVRNNFDIGLHIYCQIVFNNCYLFSGGSVWGYLLFLLLFLFKQSAGSGNGDVITTTVSVMNLNQLLREKSASLDIAEMYRFTWLLAFKDVCVLRHTINLSAVGLQEAAIMKVFFQALENKIDGARMQYFQCISNKHTAVLQ